MPRPWVGMLWLTAGLLAVLGCGTTEHNRDPGSAFLTSLGFGKKEPELKPPPQPEEFTVPPEDDGRFSKPTSYPDGTLNQFQLKKNQTLPGANQPAGGPSRLGVGSGTGRGY
jgi:hypothetical protein